ncbi:MAG: phosphatase [Opitutaceae bacterium]
MSAAPKVAIIDIGSNSIKVLVARRGTNCGLVKPVFQQTCDARISTGINQCEPRLSPDGMAAGLGAIRDLLLAAASYSPAKIQLVATSAVRDALNRNEFLALVRQETGHSIRILTGPEEAAYIGRGLLSDPVLHGTDSCYVFDLGGGSLECLAMRARQVETAISLPLGCVRLTERFVSAPELPLDPTTALAVQRHVHAVLREAHFAFDLPGDAPVIGTGGSVFTCRAMVAAQTRQTLEESSPVLPVPALQSLGDQVMAMPLAMRQQLPGLPAARADVFPAAIITLLALMAASGRTVLHHSVYNLRYGVADELLTG